MTSEHVLINGPADAQATVLLAHGAGAAMDSPFMAFFAQALGEEGIRVVRFEFPYMQRRRLEGVKAPPNSAKILQATWIETVQTFRNRTPLFLAGKSMGGRYASMIADDVQAQGLICLGYPFHPPGKPDKLRTAHLETLNTPCLIIQGERDPFGKPEEVSSYDLSKNISVSWLPDGDHSFKPRKASGFTQSQHWQKGVSLMAQFIRNPSTSA